MRAAHALGIDTFALVAAGFGRPLAVGGVGQALRSRCASRAERRASRTGRRRSKGMGEIMRIQSRPAAGRAQDHGRSRHQSGQRRDLPDPAHAVRGRHVRRHAAQESRHHLRRRSRSRVDAEDPRRAEAVWREGDVLPDRRRGGEVSRRRQARLTTKATRSATTPSPIPTSAPFRSAISKWS